METPTLAVIDSIEHCLLPKFTKDLDICENNPEFANHNNRLCEFFPSLLKSLGEADLTENHKLSSSALASLLILYKELQFVDQWTTGQAKDYSKKLDCSFQLIYNISLKSLLEEAKFNVQTIFDELLDKLLFKLTLDCWKKYPSLVEVYSSIMEDIQSCRLKLNPVKALPIAMLLMEDYVIVNKLKGVKTCRSILMRLSPEDFAQGNYYEVIYGSLKKVLLERDSELTKATCDCMMRLLTILPADVCFNKSDQLYSEVLDQLYTEANLYRKSALFNLTTQLIQILQVECVKRRKITTIFYDNLDICCTEGVADVLLLSVIECYEEWIKHCWCVWKLPKDQKLLCVLFKVLYVCKDEKITEKIIQLLIILITLCTGEERIKVIKSLDRCDEIKSEEFNQKVIIIKNSFV